MKNNTLLFIDTETGGLNAERHPVLQVAWIIEKDGVVVCSKSFDVRPSENADLCLKALEVNNFSLERLKMGKDRAFVLEQLRHDIKFAVGGKEPLKICGHRVSFDIDMLYAMARQGTESWWFNFGQNDYIQLSKPICTLAMCHLLDAEGFLKLSDYKLTSVCKYFDITLDNAHDAMADIAATRLVYHKLRALLYKSLKNP